MRSRQLSTPRESDPQSFMEVLDRGCCKFISGDMRQGTDSYCPHPRKEKSPYCEYHHQICCREVVKPDTLLEEINAGK